MTNRIGVEARPATISSHSRASGGMSCAPRSISSTMRSWSGATTTSSASASDEPDERAGNPGHEPEDGAAAGTDRARGVLSCEPHRQQPTAENPQATAVADADDRQRGKHADEETAEENGLKHG